MMKIKKVHGINESIWIHIEFYDDDHDGNKEKGDRWHGIKVVIKNVDKSPEEKQYEKELKEEIDPEIQRLENELIELEALKARIEGYHNYESAFGLESKSLMTSYIQSVLFNEKGEIFGEGEGIGMDTIYNVDYYMEITGLYSKYCTAAIGIVDKMSYLAELEDRRWINTDEITEFEEKANFEYQALLQDIENIKREIDGLELRKQELIVAMTMRRYE